MHCSTTVAHRADLPALPDAQIGYVLCNENQSAADAFEAHFGRRPALPASGDGSIGMLRGGGVFYARGPSGYPSGWLSIGVSIGKAEHCAMDSPASRVAHRRANYELAVILAAIAHGCFNNATPLFEDSVSRRLQIGTAADVEAVRTAAPDMETWVTSSEASEAQRRRLSAVVARELHVDVDAANISHWALSAVLRQYMLDRRLITLDEHWGKMIGFEKAATSLLETEPDKAVLVLAFSMDAVERALAPGARLPGFEALRVVRAALASAGSSAGFCRAAVCARAEGLPEEEVLGALRR